MYRKDWKNLIAIFVAVRQGRCRTDVSFDVGLALGYMACIRSHGFISDLGYERLEVVLVNAQEHAMATVFDLEAQGWV